MSVTVVGSLNEDVLVRVDRLPGRGETVVGRDTALAPGGKGANQAVGLAQLGVRPTLVAVAGDDAIGDVLLEQARRAGIDVIDLGMGNPTDPPPSASSTS